MNHDNKQGSRVALVTGAGRRIGAVIATHLHQAGFRVVVHCRQSLQEAQKLAHEMNKTRANSVLVLPADLTMKHAAIELITKTIKWAGRIDLLVNNASLYIRTKTDSLDDTDWDDLFTVNVRAPFWLSLAARPYLAVHKGSIINITDINAERPRAGYSIYCQSKAALTLQTKSLAYEFAPTVRVNAIAPGAMIWPEHDNAISEEEKQNIIAKTPLKQHGNPAFIAQAVLAFVENPFITGEILRVDGGRGLV